MFREIHETIGESINASRSTIGANIRVGMINNSTFDPDRRIDITKRIVVRETAEYDPDKRIVVD